MMVATFLIAVVHSIRKIFFDDRMPFRGIRILANHKIFLRNFGLAGFDTARDKVK